MVANICGALERDVYAHVGLREVRRRLYSTARIVATRVAERAWRRARITADRYGRSSEYFCTTLATVQYALFAIVTASRSVMLGIIHRTCPCRDLPLAPVDIRLASPRALRLPPLNDHLLERHRHCDCR